MISIIELVVSLLASLLENAKTNGLPAEVIAAIEAAVANLKSVQGTPVTYSQLESLRVTPEW